MFRGGSHSKVGNSGGHGVFLFCLRSSRHCVPSCFGGDSDEHIPSAERPGGGSEGPDGAPLCLLFCYADAHRRFFCIRRGQEDFNQISKNGDSTTELCCLNGPRALRGSRHLQDLP